MATLSPPPAKTPFLTGDIVSREWIMFFEQLLRGYMADETLHLGDPTVDGSWRIIINGSDLDFDRRESSAWVNKGQFAA